MPFDSHLLSLLIGNKLVGWCGEGKTTFGRRSDLSCPHSRDPNPFLSASCTQFATPEARHEPSGQCETPARSIGNKTKAGLAPPLNAK